MASQEKPVFLEDATGTLIYTPTQGTPTGSPTVTIYDYAGAVLVASSAATIAGATLTKALTTTHTATKGRNFRARWVYTVSSTSYTRDQLFDVVAHVLSPTLTQAKLLHYAPNFTDYLWSGVADFSNQIDRAWDEYVLAGIRQAKRDPHSIIDPYPLEYPHALFALYLCARGFGPDETWQSYATARLAEGRAALEAALSVVEWYDDNQDLIPAAGELDAPASRGCDFRR